MTIAVDLGRKAIKQTNFKKSLLFSICCIAKQSFQPIYFSNEKNLFADNWRAEPTIFSIERISYSLKLLSGHFYTQYFIKTVLGPLCNNIDQTETLFFNALTFSRSHGKC